MSNTDTETQTPVEASNQSAALPGSASSPGPAAASGGASAAYGGASTAAPAAEAPAPVSKPYVMMTTPVAINIPNPRARPATSRPGSTAAPTVDASSGGVAAVEYAIRDRTSAEGMTSQALVHLESAAQYAAQAGLARIVVVSGRGPGHRSHEAGTEWDLMGYNADGSKWTREQRVAVAAGARAAGATRFGFYEYGENYPTNDGRLHIGYRGPAATWGAGGNVRGAASRRYSNEAERAFSSAFYAGVEFDYAPFLGKTARPPEADNAPGAVPYAGDPFGVSASKATIEIPDPRLRAEVMSQPAFGAQGARDGGMPEPVSTAALGATIIDNGQFLRRGSKGDATAEWQSFLNSQGFDLAVDGDFGRRTRAATKRWQSMVEIEADGVVGPESYRAALFAIDPAAGPLSDGDVAYRDGALAAAAIIDPVGAEQMRREVDIALPRQRPERGAGVPNPPANPRRAAGEQPPAEWSSIDEMTQVDAAGNYLNPVPGRSAASGDRVLYGPAETGRMVSDFRGRMIARGVPEETAAAATLAFEKAFKSSGQYRYASGLTPAELGKMTSDFRDSLIARDVSGDVLDMAVTTYERALKTVTADYRRVSDASAAARRATAQRFSGLAPVTDRFRPRDPRRGDEIERVRVTEAVREYTRGILDTYLRVRERQQAASLSGATGAERLMGNAAGDRLEDDTKTAYERGQVVTDMMLRSTPTPAEEITQQYAFGGGVPSSLLWGIMERAPNKEAPITQRWRDHADRSAKNAEAWALKELQAADPSNTHSEEIARAAREYGEQVRHDILYSTEGAFGVGRTYGGRALIYGAIAGEEFTEWLTMGGFGALMEALMPPLKMRYSTGGRF